VVDEIAGAADAGSDAARWEWEGVVDGVEVAGDDVVGWGGGYRDCCGCRRQGREGGDEDGEDWRHGEVCGLVWVWVCVVAGVLFLEARMR